MGYRSAVDVPAMPHPQNQDGDPPVLEVADQPIIAYPVLPELTQLWSAQRLSEAAGIIQYGHPLAQDAAGFASSFLARGSNSIL